MSHRRYVVWVGRKPGIYKTWDECRAQTDGFQSARFKRFNSQEEAEWAFKQDPMDLFKGKPTDYQPKPEQPIEAYDFTLFCDGGCNPNPGASGTGLAVMLKGELIDLWLGYHALDGTNNRAELLGVIEGLRYCAALKSMGLISGTRKAALCCDSRYAINCITRYAINWKKNNWTRQDGGEIQNLELIQEAVDLYQSLKNQVDLRKVKAHSGLFGNEVADDLATEARRDEYVDWCQHPSTHHFDDDSQVRRKVLRNYSAAPGRKTPAWCQAS